MRRKGVFEEQRAATPSRKSRRHYTKGPLGSATSSCDLLQYSQLQSGERAPFSRSPWTRKDHLRSLRPRISATKQHPGRIHSRRSCGSQQSSQQRYIHKPVEATFPPCNSMRSRCTVTRRCPRLGELSIPGVIGMGGGEAKASLPPAILPYLGVP